MTQSTSEPKPPQKTRPHLQSTELFTIKSSPQKGNGPHPRALRRRDEKYMLPRSPESPTPRKKIGSGSRSHLPSSSVHRRTKDCFTSVDVSQLIVETFSIQAAATASDSMWSPKEQTKEMDVRRAPSFDPSQKLVTSFSLLRSLDLFPALGLAPVDFWSLFSRCQMCSNYMTTRTTPYHRCPAIISGISGGLASEEKIYPSAHQVNCLNLRALDAHDVGNEGGVSEESFLAAFSTCRQCGRYTTRRMASPHADSEFDKDYSGKCVYLALQQADPVGKSNK